MFELGLTNTLRSYTVPASAMESAEVARIEHCISPSATLTMVPEGIPYQHWERWPAMKPGSQTLGKRWVGKFAGVNLAMKKNKRISK